MTNIRRIRTSHLDCWADAEGKIALQPNDMSIPALFLSPDEVQDLITIVSMLKVAYDDRNNG